MNKKAQGEIITTVLIILLVLAAIVIVWQVVSTSVRSGAEQIPGQTDCLTLKIDIVSATAGAAGSAKLKLKREVGTGALAGVKVFVADAYSENIDLTTTANKLDELETQEYTLTKVITAGQNVKIAKLVGADVANARLCEFLDNSGTGGVAAP